MIKIPREVANIFNDPESVKVLVTLNEHDVPHCVPIGTLAIPTVDIIAFAVIMAERTHQNLLNNPDKIVTTTAVKGWESYQIKAKPVEYLTEGAAFDAFRQRFGTLILGTEFEIKGVWILEPLEIYNQSIGPESGERIA
ncbi:MAG: pyridoxamine 5'-phosphate oxidase family protein [Candidatus Jordarchaeum sp.]|uniref:pyridoxamine 5'-phosphate oxidase family protein n=1 Tax=Candidatus Jordarchaeum sp. TaxID=2823881 RepID=UPI004049D424